MPSKWPIVILSRQSGINQSATPPIFDDALDIIFCNAVAIGSLTFSIALARSPLHSKNLSLSHSPKDLSEFSKSLSCLSKKSLIFLPTPYTHSNIDVNIFFLSSMPYFSQNAFLSFPNSSLNVLRRLSSSSFDIGLPFRAARSFCI